MNFITIFPRSFWVWTKGFKVQNLKKIWQNVQIGTEWKSNSFFFSYQKLTNLFRGWNGGVNSWLVFLQNIRLQLLTWLGYSTTRHHQKILFKIEIYIKYTFLLCNPWRRLLNLYKKLSGIFWRGQFWRWMLRGMEISSSFRNFKWHHHPMDLFKQRLINLVNALWS